eukprot:3152801-Prymnesium_polylepis.1
MNAQQEDMYESIGDVALTSLRQGFNSTILAYGQTGSGKTYSMEGLKEAGGRYTSKGLIPRIFENVFKMFQQDEDVKSFEVAIQFVELYNEQLQDLLGQRKIVEVSSDPSGGYRAKDAVRHVCKDPEDAHAIYDKGCRMRATAATQMNDVSSRSHALLQINVSWVEKKGKSFGVLNLVDLAGCAPRLAKRTGPAPSSSSDLDEPTPASGWDIPLPSCLLACPLAASPISCYTLQVRGYEEDGCDGPERQGGHQDQPVADEAGIRRQVSCSSEESLVVAAANPSKRKLALFTRGLPLEWVP